jgi:cytochrome P450
MTPLRGPGLPAAVQTVAFARDPVGVMLRCRRRFGPVFSLDLRWAGPTVVVTDFKAAQPLVDGEGSIARAGSARRRVLPQASAGSSFGADGERHRELRARIAPALAAERVEAERDAVAAVAERRLDDWPPRSTPAGRPRSS